MPVRVTEERNPTVPQLLLGEPHAELEVNGELSAWLGVMAKE